MTPRHLQYIPDDRKAVAPYNFVELPTKVVEAELEPDGNLRNNDCYHTDRLTGKIKCTLKTVSPLYIRCGLTTTEFSEFGDQTNENLTQEQRRRKANFFHHSTSADPVIPGSSLRGMLRTLVEIISFGKIEKVSDKPKFFFRAVAAESDDPLSTIYNLDRIRVGYLEFDHQQNKWFIHPAQKLDNKFFKRVKEESIKDQLPSLIPMKELKYIPQYIEISFNLSDPISVSEGLDQDKSHHGWLVTSGNMLENQLEKTTERETLLRKNHYIVGEIDKSKQKLEISSGAIRDYCDSLTKFQQGEEKPFKDNRANRFKKQTGILQDGLPIFYCEPKTPDNLVILFGQSPNFRIPYSSENNRRAASAKDFIPEEVGEFAKTETPIPGEVGESTKIDLADAIFGFVRRKKQPRQQSRAGRVFVSDALYTNHEQGLWLDEQTTTPHILATPKPTTFQHYLVQTSSGKQELKHYASGSNQTVIRGHKLYWHKRSDIQTKVSEAEINKKRSQYTEIKPINSKVSFEFVINFENLTNIELGALLWVLVLASSDSNQLKLLNLDDKDKYLLSLGIGKPLGMGSIEIEKFQLIIDDRHSTQPQKRYTQLFDGNNWLTGNNNPVTPDEYSVYLDEFAEYVVTNVDKNDLPEGCLDGQGLGLKDLPRIQMLLAMLSYNFPPSADTRYMEIERDVKNTYLGKPVKDGESTKDEYVDRLVLPTPFQVKNCEHKDTRKMTDAQ